MLGLSAKSGLVKIKEDIVHAQGDLLFDQFIQRIQDYIMPVFGRGFYAGEI